MPNDDEQKLLASLSASIQEQNSYEANVIKEATHSLAPSLTGVGLPSLHALAPSYDQRMPDSFNPSDLHHVHTLLSRTRKQLQKEPLSERLHLKEQLLLSFLGNVAGVQPEELPVRLNEERAREAKRSEGLQSQKHPPQSAQEEETSKQKRRRVPIMKRKRASGENDDENERDVAELKNRLRQIREDRKRRKLERRKAWDMDVDHEEEEEATFDDSNAAAGDEAADTATETALKEEAKQDDIAPDSAECPLCRAKIVADSGGKTELDAALSSHMAECQSKRPTRRSTRRSAAARVNYAETGDLEDEPRADATKVSAVTKKAVLGETVTKPTMKKARRPPAPIAARAAPSLDDFDEEGYEERVDDWIENGLSKMKNMKERDDQEELPGAERYPGNLWVPAWVNDRLFGYQRKSLQWLWELHQQEAGGLIGDEMGLGKTVQVSTYIGVLAANRKLRSVLVVSPATMLQHWLNELAVWAPGLRRLLVHTSGESDGHSRSISSDLLRSLSSWLKRSRSSRLYEAIDDEDLATMPPHSFPGTGYVIVTTYESVRRNADIYTGHSWSYVVLDEAQKIRNPDADVTLACKRIRTPHRIAMSGTPIQNDLRELWSLFDFVFPGRLGTLPAFEQEFADPIKRGGYSNATPMQVQLAYRCSLMLKDLIDPYMLRRQKREVKEVSRMPGKTEHVLFCRLSQRQRALYEAYLQSDEVKRVLKGTHQMFAAVTMLRKICNHPDLVCDPDEASFETFVKSGCVQTADFVGDNFSDSDDEDDKFADEETLVERSGKLEVLSKILPLWKKQGHRVLIFCQWKKMLNIIQRFVMQKGWKFGRLDGNTNVAARQRLVDAFNSDESYYGMLCTTRTGGVGLNLTGANRIILYDPDWNPQTDAQARERAWRFGQEREVTVYRLITAGAIEEKIYQRQIFKTALSNKVLSDPKQRRLFSHRDLKDLFGLKADTGSVRAGGDGLTETGAAAKGVGVVDPVDEPGEDTSADNEATLKNVMKSKGLAGIFDHKFVEHDPSRKSITTREMEDQAKKIAREAANALRHSLANHNRFEPTWTGSRETESRFSAGTTRNGGHPTVSQGSGGLLSSLRQRIENVQTLGETAPPTEEAKAYSRLLLRIKEFVRRRRPSTDVLLQEFGDVPTADVAIFRRLLKSVATVKKGKWYLSS